MGFGERQPQSEIKVVEEGSSTPLRNKNHEKDAANPKEHMKHNEGICLKFRSPTVPLLYVIIGGAISVTVIIILAARPSVRDPTGSYNDLTFLEKSTASAVSDKDFTFLEKSTGETPETEVVEGPICAQCEDDWISYRGKCYYISDQIATWTDSQDFCKSHDSSLAIIHNEKEKNFLNLLKSKNNYWIGLSRTQDDSGWVWTNGAFYSEKLFTIGRKPAVPGETEKVYLNGEGFKSESGKYKNKWICSTLF